VGAFEVLGKGPRAGFSTPILGSDPDRSSRRFGPRIGAFSGKILAVLENFSQFHRDKLRAG
jgi:hypothetical protein